MSIWMLIAIYMMIGTLNLFILKKDYQDTSGETFALIYLWPLCWIIEVIENFGK